MTIAWEYTLSFVTISRSRQYHRQKKIENAESPKSTKSKNLDSTLLFVAKLRSRQTHYHSCECAQALSHLCILQCAATCCNVLQCVAHIWLVSPQCQHCIVTAFTHVCILQCVATCCSVLQCVAHIWLVSPQCQHCVVMGRTHVCILQCVAVCCSVLQCVAPCCAQQCVATWGSVLQCVAHK